MQEELFIGWHRFGRLENSPGLLDPVQRFAAEFLGLCCELAGISNETPEHIWELGDRFFQFVRFDPQPLENRGQVIGDRVSLITSHGSARPIQQAQIIVQ